MSVAAITLGGAGFAAAATMALTSRKLGDGQTTVTSCQTSTLRYSHVVDSSHTVSKVTVGNIDAACSGAVLYLNMANSANASIGAVTVTLPASSGITYATLTIPQQPVSANVARYVVGFAQ